MWTNRKKSSSPHATALLACASALAACNPGIRFNDDPPDSNTRDGERITEPASEAGGANDGNGLDAATSQRPSDPSSVGDGEPSVMDAGRADAGSIAVAPSCDTAALPREGLIGWLSAGVGITTDGAGVSGWADQARSDRVAFRASGQPTIVADAANGRPAIRFDGVDDVLHWPSFELNGKTELTVALINATDFKAPGQEWCCSDDETGCSGTYHVPLFWNGTADWSGVLIAPVQEEVALRFGNGVKHYSDNFYDLYAWKQCGQGLPQCAGGIPIGSDPSCCGYGSCQDAWQRDPGVAWRRPVSIGRDFSLTVTVKKAEGYDLYVMGEHVSGRPMPGGVAEIKNAESYARIGSAGPFGNRRWQGDIAEIAVYERALDENDRRALEQYMLCQYFP